MFAVTAAARRLDLESVAGIHEGSLYNQNLQPNRTYQRISPRLGVAFPLDEKTILRFNYGQFYQQPNLQDLYVSYRFLEYKILHTGSRQIMDFILPGQLFGLQACLFSRALYSVATITDSSLSALPRNTPRVGGTSA